MAAYFIDTSALVKRHVREDGTAWVRSLTSAKTLHTIYIARITVVEITSAITRRQRGGSLSLAQGRAILAHFQRHQAHRYHVLELPPALFTRAAQLAQTHGLRAYDATQLAAALEVDQLRRAAALVPMTLISADAELNAAATVEGLMVDDPNDHA